MLRSLDLQPTTHPLIRHIVPLGEVSCGELYDFMTLLAMFSGDWGFQRRVVDFFITRGDTVDLLFRLPPAAFEEMSYCMLV
jgi:hypothetical protein